MHHLSIDEVYDIIGHLGYGQVIYFLSLSVIQVYTALHMLLNIYTGLDVPFICASRNVNGITMKSLKNECFENRAANCQFVFDISLSTVVSEWHLVCDEKYKIALIQSIWMGGVMCGALFLSSLADYFGRLKTLMISLMGMIAFEGFASFSTTYVIFVVLRFVGGMMCSVVILVSFVLSQELVGASRRSICGIVLTSFFPFGIALLSIMAAHLTDWRTLTLFASVLGVIYLLLPFYIPESPRWLAGKGKLKAAKKVMEFIALKNGTAHLLPSHWQVSIGGQEKDPRKRDGIFALMSNSYLRRITLILINSWFVNSAVYYALTMAAASSDPEGSVYWATTMNGFMEIPAYVCSVLIIDRYGRKFTICAFMLMGGLLCMLIPFLPSYVTYLALMGKLGISASFAVIYLHSGEIFPTVIRNAAMGMTSVAARIGGIVSPFVLMLGDAQPNLHFAVLGLATFIAGILNMGLPETLGRPLPETISDILAFEGQDASPAIKTSSGDRGKKYRKVAMEEDEEERGGGRPIPGTRREDEVPLIHA